MAHIKNMSNRAYISGNLKNKLSRFEMYRYSFIYAPTGYGKSKITKSFFKNYSGYTVLWIDAESSREIFWENFCNAVKLLNVSLAESFKNIGFPDSDEDPAVHLHGMKNLSLDCRSAWKTRQGPRV